MHSKEIIIGVIGNWEVFAKYGNRWSYRGVYSARTSRGAALKAGYVLSRRVIGVRPENSHDKLQVFRFGFTPEAHHGS